MRTSIVFYGFPQVELPRVGWSRYLTFAAQVLLAIGLSWTLAIGGVLLIWEILKALVCSGWVLL